MADCEWEDATSSNRREGRGRGGGGGGGRTGGTHGRGNNYNKNKEESQGDDFWGNDSNGKVNGDRDVGSSRNHFGRSGGRNRGGRASNNGDSGDFGDEQPPVNDKPRPTYIPPEIDDNEYNGIEAGLNFNKYEKIEVKVSGDSVPKHIESFKNSGLREVLIEKLAKCNYIVPTPIQKYAIPIIINGRDMMASAQTGSGKTVSVY